MPANWKDSMFQQVIDALPEGILYCDRHYIVRKVNKSYASLLGGDVDSILGRPLPDLNPATRAASVIASGVPEMGDLCTLPLFGDAYKFVVNRIPVRGASGAVEGMISQILFTDPAELTELHRKIDFLAKKQRIYNTSIKAKHRDHYDIDSIIGSSAPMLEVKSLIRRYALHPHPVLVQGKTGTGKELVAHALHTSGAHPDGPFVGINCAAIPKELFEAELFGYAPGAFSGAHKDGKIGLFELADGGTLFLDEIGDMPAYSQVKLLRILEEKKVTRIGAVTPRQVDFRLITATNRDLLRMVAEGTFREDLYYRINMLNIRLPALCERAEDILPLSRHILSTIGYAGLDFTPAASAAMRSYAWPGNVRQLFNSLVRASIHAANKVIDLSDLPAEIPDCLTREEKKEARRSRSLTDYMASQEAGYITSRLIENRGNISLTAQELGVSRVTLYGKLKKYGISAATRDGEDSPDAAD